LILETPHGKRFGAARSEGQTQNMKASRNDDANRNAIGETNSQKAQANAILGSGGRHQEDER